MYSRLPRGLKRVSMRRRLIQGARPLLQQRQIVQRVVDDVAADMGAPMAGDDLDPVDIALHHDLLVGVHRRRRVVHQPVAHQGRGQDLARHVLAGLEGNGRQIAQGVAVARSPASNTSRRSRQRAIGRSFRTDRSCTLGIGTMNRRRTVFTRASTLPSPGRSKRSRNR